MVTCENWRQRMEADMRLRDFSERTREGYGMAVTMFMRWACTEPEEITEEHVRRYVLHLRVDRKQAPSSINIAVCALKFFFTHSVPRGWAVFELMRVKHPKRLPIVLSTTEVRAILSMVRHPMHRMALTTIYALGLRLGEALRLQTEHIDGQRLMVSVRNGKGRKDRSVPLPRPLLERLRRYWKVDRPRGVPGSYLFVAEKSQREGPLHATTLQKTLIAVQREAVPNKHATIHTLRHSYATHLLESGISLKTIQQLMGHKSLKTTEVYLHVTQPGMVHLQEVLDRLMADL